VITLPTNATAAIMMAVHHQRNDAMGSASFRSAIPRSMRSRAASWPASYAQTLIRDRESLAMNIRDSACLFGNTGSPIRSMAWNPVNGSRRLQRRAFERKDGAGTSDPARLLSRPRAKASPKRAATNFRHLIPMIGRTGENGNGPVELFGQHQTHDRMWPDHSSKRQSGMGTVPKIGIQPVRTANQKRHVPDTIVAPFTQLTSELG